MTNNEANKEQSADSVFMKIDIFVYAYFFLLKYVPADENENQLFSM